ncbi:hypothetical protein ESA94_04220 [Lacibacter luteus]|uniref:Uncharacterized protein n=1 Tax=Lacibacter luteus TaxID=2508719 RepID=A0A4Q1CMH0_9BACT|nr:hypothetical protein [Lacibacter luteus]RXK62223.1 hypothetical protein ESA94_04220 [Lacibacter luteus]
MKGFLFVSKLAFILNLLFVVCLVLRLSPVQLSGSWVSVLVIAGWFLAFLVNIPVTAWFAILLAGKKLTFEVKSVHFFNAAILIIQSIFFFL